MSESFGGDLRFSSGSDMGFGASPAAGPSEPIDISPQGPGSVPNEPAPYAPPAQSPGPSFGGMLKSILPGPNYRTPDPATSALDQSADLLEQRVKRANSIATNPLAQFFAPEAVQKARDFVPQAAEQLQKIQTQKSAIAAGRVQAGVLGLAPGEVSDQATQDDRLQVAMDKALKGDMRAFQGIQAIAPERAAAIAPQVHEVVAGHLEKAQLAFDSLAGMDSQGKYQGKLQQLRDDGTLRDLESLGMKVPPNFEAFNAVKAKEGLALREARISIDAVRQKMEDRNTYQPMEKKEAETYNGRIKTAYGDDVSAGPWSRNGVSGTRGQVVNGGADPNNLGKTFTLATPDQRKAIKEEFEGAVPKVEVEKNRNFNRISTLATTGTDGKFIPAEGVIRNGQRIYLNDNPNIQQGLSEGFAAELRGGLGGATGTLLNIESGKRGAVQALLDKINAGYGGALNTITGAQVRNYLTQLTQQQQRQVMDGLREYNQKSLSDRGGAIAQRAGALGLDGAALGLGKDEAPGAIADAIEAGRLTQIERMKPNWQAIGGGDGVMQIGAQRPGAGATALPPGTGNANQLPNAAPLLTPVQQQAQPPAAPQNAPPQPVPAAPSGAPVTPPGGGGAPTPVQPQPLTIAGQQVSAPALPAGMTPDYYRKTQRIESGNEKDPWTAGSGLSSAGGAFQFIKSTWAADKPPGAPDRAQDATPQQQIEATATRARKEAANLTRNGLPVNDTTVYIAHNLGGGAAPALLKADPDADARTVVGEAAARNNPLFFKGRPTVATVLQRYQSEMDKEPDGPKPRPGAGGATAEVPGLMSRIASLLAPLDNPESRKFAEKYGRRGDVIGMPGVGKDALIENAPAIGSTAGAVAGGALGNLPGAVAGGAAGGGAGQALKDYLQGNPQSATEIAKQGALGGALGIVPAGRPIAGAVARVLGVGGVEAGAEAAKGGDAAEVADAALKGGAYALAGEALGRFISAAGPAAHKLFSKFTPEAQAELSAQAGKLVAARKVLESEQPKLAGEGAGPNPKYEAAKKAEDDAAQYIKDHGQKPDDMAYAYEQTKAGTSAGEAATLRKANTEKTAVGEGYDQLRQDVRGAKPNEKNIKPNQSLPDGPVAQIRTPENPTGKVAEAFRPDAEHAEMLVRAPAKDWGAKWQQLQDAGSELIKKRMDFMANGDKTSAQAMKDIFKGVRNQQEAVAERLFGPKQGAEVITHLENLDKRYAQVMNATAGMNYEKMRGIIQGGNTPARRELEANFKEFAKDDPSAIRAFNAMKAGAQGRLGEEAKLMIPVIAGEFAANAGGIPTVGVISAAIGGHRMYSLMREYMNAKVLGKPVTFKDFFIDHLKSSGVMPGNAVQRAAVQGTAPAGTGNAIVNALP